MRATDPRPIVRRRGERGFALAAAIFALVVIAALVTGIFFSARQELRLGMNSVGYGRAADAAEAGLHYAVANWNTQTWNKLNVGDSAAISGSLPGGTGNYNGTVRRLNTQLFLIRSTGTDRAGSSQRTVAMLTRLLLIQMSVEGALTAQGTLKVGGSSFIDGRDQTPTGWSCPGVSMDTLPGITVKDTTKISYSGCNNQTCLAGDPKVAQDTSIKDSTFFKFGQLNWTSLTAMAGITLPGGSYAPAPVGTATTCNTATLTNWGDPYKPATVAGCSNYFPIIHITGNLQGSQGYGQGILMIDGDLKVTGNFEFYGPVIVRGSFSTAGNGNHFYGGVLAADVDLSQNSVLGNAVVTYSSCTLAQALTASSPARQFKERSWTEVF